MATFFPGGVFSVNSLTSSTMAIRDQRLKIAKTHADKTQRELARDRMNLERKEKQLLTECKKLASRGDMRGARMVANQIACYRRIHDRNLQASINIGTQAQAMVSDHKVNRGQVETIKGFAFANTYESFSRMEAREQRYSFRMGAISHLESNMRESMDEAFSNEEYSPHQQEFYSQDGPEAQAARIRELEMQTILNQAIGKEKNRLYFPPADSLDASDIEAPFILNIKSFDRPGFGTSITLNPIVSAPNDTSPLFSINTATIDCIKRRIMQDSYAAGQLDLYGNGGSYIRPFEIGRYHADSAEFESLDFAETIASADIRNGDFLFVRLLQASSGGSSSGGSTSTSPPMDHDEMLVRQRINRINGRS